MAKSVTDGDRLELNLEILGKLSRGDMIAAAGEDGKFVRKTNFLTQAWRKGETHDKDLFTQIQNVLDDALDKIKNDPETPLGGKYLQALKGLEVLLSTYRSKGSKEFAYVEQLTLVLKAHDGAREPDPRAGKLIDLGKRAIHYLEDCRIRSTNNYFFKKGGHEGKYFGYKVDAALLELFVRNDDATFISKVGTKVEFEKVRDAVLKIMQQSVSRSEKRTLLEKKLNDLLGGDGRNYTAKELLRLVPEKGQELTFFKRSRVPRDPMNERLQSAQNAIRMRFGNCGQKASVVATWLSENTASHDITIARVGAIYNEETDTGYDHNWVFMSREAKLIDAIESCIKKTTGNAATYKDLFPRDTVVVDGWTADCWVLRDWFNSVGNPRQLTVRRRIRKVVEKGLIKAVFETVKWPPLGEYSNFRLRFANMPDWGWHLKKSSSVPAEIRQSIVEQSELHEAATMVSHHSMRTISETSDSVDYEDGYEYRLLRPWG